MTKRDSSENDHERDGMIDSAMSSSEPGQSTAEEQTTPDDVSAIHADDALLDALSGSDPGTADGLGDQELNALLLAWRRDVDSDPLPELVDASTAATTIRTATLVTNRRGRAPARRRLLVPAAAAAAVLAIGFTGTALAARDAQPGDTLWGLSQVLYADHARTIEAAAAVRIDLRNAYLAIAQERYDDARRSLAEAERALNQVPVEGELVQLKARHTQLMEQLEQPETTATPTPPTSSTPSDTSTSTGTDSSVTSSTPSPSTPSSTPSDPSTSTTSEPSTPTTTPTPSSPTDGSNSESSGSNPRFGASVPLVEPTD